MKMIPAVIKSSIEENLGRELFDVIGELRNEVYALREENLHLKDLLREMQIKNDKSNFTLISDTIRGEVEPYNEVVGKKSTSKVKDLVNKNPTLKSTTVESTGLSAGTGNSEPKDGNRTITTNDEFTTFIPKRKRKIRKYGILGKTEEFKAITSLSHIHVSNLDPKLNPEKIIKYLTDHSFKEVKCTRLRSNRPEEYSSFEISVMSADSDKVKNPDLWPEGTRINNFLFHLFKKPPSN